MAPYEKLATVTPKKPVKGQRMLPQNALHTLFSYLDMYSLGVATLVCKQWFDEGSKDSVWATLAANLRFPCYYADLTNTNEQHFNRKNFL